MIHQCPVCKATIPLDSKLGDFCTHANCPSYMMNNLEEPNADELYPSHMSDKECPVCENRYAVACVGESCVVWCGYGSCPSGAAEQGAEAPTEEAAIAKLHRMIELEVQQNNRHGPMCGCACCMDLTLAEHREGE